MSLLNGLILGVIEGITEFLPISSTAHLIIAARLLHIEQTQFQKFFEVFIQSGAILAVLFLYTSYVLKHRSLLKKIFISFLPTAVVGLILYEIIKNVFFESFSLISFSLLFIGVIFFFLEYAISRDHIKLKRHIEHMSLKDALVIGLIQSLAVVPGVSRAGIVMIGMILLQYKREESAMYSFLLAVPTIIAASALDLYKSRDLLAGYGQNVLVLAIGFFTAFVTATITIKWFMKYLQNHSLSVFAFYRIALAIILFTYFLR